MDIYEATRILLEAITKIEEGGFTVVDAATRDQNLELQHAAVDGLGGTIYIQEEPK